MNIFMAYHFKIFTTVSEFPDDWDFTVGRYNVMLSKSYFYTLEESKPNNMECVFAGFFGDNELIGGALIQYLSFSEHKTFQKNEILCSIRNFITKQFSRDLLILGNNMLTGQNGFYFNPSKITSENAVLLLHEALLESQQLFGKPSLVSFKDYQRSFLKHFETKNFEKYYRFSVQPNMILNIRKEWRSMEDYSNDFSKKYRARFKSAKKKLDGIQRFELNLEQVKKYQQDMNLLYHNVAENAPFNTFFLRENHFESMKFHLGHKFRVFGYFLEEKLIGFYTLIINNKDVDTYFLGYDKEIQKEKQIYLNMLFDMAEFGIENRFERIIFGRTALEIKSTIGAEPVEIFGLIRHKNKWINFLMEKIFTSVNPKTDWIQRKPFK
ncbi:8-amino-7-oxononanoate synthase [Chryseobacterium taihuense]|uniref:8-amino-7-oxononanoate synthase n=1 Tax=Chryseobacterium taihuense TaxID=1141221 RepID=A0ABY0QQ47_9FLAO|nr:8-amino-7-oxononanoate synthase [Chryseobacterium taihuense]SDL46967.1 hypothetical protein SAMN05216273_101306 [Chryseobacterium taihuense]